MAGQDVPSFGSRKVKTKLRLREGESNLLAGLLRDEQRKILTGFPGVIRVPVLRSLFGQTTDEINQTDIVMLLTPHIVRTHELTADDLAPIYIGTQQNVGLGGPPPLIAPLPATRRPPAPAPAPAARRAIPARRRPARRAPPAAPPPGVPPSNPPPPPGTSPVPTFPPPGAVPPHRRADRRTPRRRAADRAAGGADAARRPPPTPERRRAIRTRRRAARRAGRAGATPAQVIITRPARRSGSPAGRPRCRCRSTTPRGCRR